MFFNIVIDEALLTFLASRKLKLEELFVITCFNLGRIDTLRVYLNGRTGDQITAYLQTLVRKQLLRVLAPEVVEFDWDNYELTDYADEIYDITAVNIVDNVPESVTPEPKKPSKKEQIQSTEEFATLIRKFTDLWPVGARNASGTYLRTNERDMINKMVNFVTRYKKYDMDTILRATEAYLRQQSRDGYAYCSSAHFFVSKNGVSKLADECEKILNGGGTPSSDAWINRM